MPASSAAAATNSTTIFTTLQGTSVLGQDVPLLGTQGYNVDRSDQEQHLCRRSCGTRSTSPADVNVSLGSLEVANVYVDPHMAR